ncbi:MAG: hypothetical protein HQ510_01765, partial [Candidatus Marinimicrobia bacterium]|nr:hypothetical protein [Candidatus Neomarinimicrobiota bacterium]
MNKLYSIILFSLTLITLVLADIPQKISYQGILLNSETGELLEGAYDLTFKLYDSESNELWSETQSSELTGGVFNILLGSITSLELPFDQPYFMGITVNDDPELSPRIELSSSAYSFTTGSILGGVAVKSINDLKDDILITGGENVTVAQSGNSLIISSNALGDSDNDWVRVGDTLYSAPDSTVTIRNGKVGIGKQNPTLFRLEVESEMLPGATLSADALFQNRSGMGGGLAIMTGDSIGVLVATSMEDTDMNIGFMPKESGSPHVEAMRISSNGNVGIGTVTPSSKLEVAGDDSTTTIDINNSLYNGGISQVRFKSFGMPRYSLGLDHTNSSYGKFKIGMTTPANNTLLTIDAGGNVGIGTTSPSTKLEVAGQVKITGGSPGSGKVLTSDGTGLASWQTPTGGGGADSDWTVSGNNMYSQPSGNIGIGTTTPGVKFDVSGKIRSNEAIHVLHSSGNASTFEVSSNDLFIHNSSAGEIGFGTSTFNSQSIRRLTIKNDGNVGIGTDTPSTKLEVAGQVKITGGSPGSGKVLTSDGTGLASWQTPTGGGGADSDWTVSGNNMYSQPSGNVGIGTTAPTRKLHVHDSAPTSAVKFTNPVTGLLTNDGLEIGTTGQMAQVWNYENGPIRFGTNNDFRMIIEDSGRVAIGGNFSAASTVHIHDSAPTSAVKFTNPVTGL